MKLRPRSQTISPRERRKVPFSAATGHGELMHECFPNTHAWEQQERNKTKRQLKIVRREAWVWKEAKRAQTIEVPTAYHIQIKIHQITLAVDSGINTNVQNKLLSLFCIQTSKQHLFLNMLYHTIPLLFEMFQCVCWNLVLQKEFIEFYINSFSNHFNCTIL